LDSDGYFYSTKLFVTRAVQVRLIGVKKDAYLHREYFPP